MKKHFNCWLPVVLAAFFALTGIYEFLQYRHFSNLEKQHTTLKLGITACDSITDDREAVTAYRRLSRLIPEVQLRILQRQWSIALEMMHQLQLAKYNSLLEKDVPEMTDALKNHLEEMKNGCSSLLTGNEPGKNNIAWQAYNLYGAVKLLDAFIVLENEKNMDKAQGMLKEAISFLKSSIAQVDIANSSVVEKNIPRWNLELLYANQYVKQYEMLKSENEGRLELEDNLEALIPERGGYAPGEPLERRIEK